MADRVHTLAMDKLTREPQKDKKPLGVAESGQLIRKTSIRRRISIKKDDVVEEIPYGTKQEAYDKISEKVISDPGVQKTLEALQEKWRMIMFMYDDCMDLRQTKLDHDQKAKRERFKRECIALVVTYLLITIPSLIVLYLTFIFVVWFLTTAG